MKYFEEKVNERFSTASANIYIMLGNSPKEKILDLNNKYPEFTAEGSRVIDEETTKHVKEEEHNTD